MPSRRGPNHCGQSSARAKLVAEHARNATYTAARRIRRIDRSPGIHSVRSHPRRSRTSYDAPSGQELQRFPAADWAASNARSLLSAGHSMIYLLRIRWMGDGKFQFLAAVPARLMIEVE